MKIDVFISYSHLDNQEDGTNPGWVSIFHRNLDIRLKEIGCPVSIWRDDINLRGTGTVQDIELKHLEAARCVVAVVSPNFLRSPYCEAELRRFVDTQSSNALVFKATKYPVNLEQQWEEIRPFFGVDFYEVDPGGKVREYHPRFGGDQMVKLWSAVDDFAQTIRERMTTTEAAPTGPTVYLAETTSDLLQIRRDLQRSLRHHGLQVIPDRPLPQSEPYASEAIREALKRADVAIHLVGAHTSLIPEGADAPIVQLQLDEARRVMPAGRCLVWMPPALSVKDERQSRFIQALRDDPGPVDILVSSVEDFTHAVLTKAREKPPEAKAAVDHGNVAFLMQSEADLEFTLELESALSDRGYEVNIPAFDAGPEERERAQARALEHATLRVLYWGAETSAWVQQQLSALRESAGDAPVPTLLIVAPPDGPMKKRALLTTRPGVIQVDARTGSIEDAALAALDASRGRP